MYILEGNIGAGKSTLLRKIQQNDDIIEVIMEPVHAWHKQESSQSLLTSFYNDTQRWAFSVETYVMACRVKEHLNEQHHTHPYRLFERSIYSGHYCFAHNSFNSGFMTPVEWDIYKQWFMLLTKNKCKLPSGFIYLKASPEICFERIKKRNRPGEENIKIKELHYETDGAFDKWINGPFTKVVLKVDSEEELLELYDKIKEANILVSLIKDAGRTELGKPTYTCIGVGPDYEEKINEFTGHLPLYK